MGNENAMYAIKKVSKNNNNFCGYLSGFDKWQHYITDKTTTRFTEKEANDFIALKKLDEEYIYSKELI